MIHLLELEPLEERYTAWWEDFIPNEIRKLKRPVNVISGEAITTKVETGTVLDAGGTNYWKAEQLKKVAAMFYNGEIKPHDHFLVADIWFPGIEMIPYMSELYNIPVHIWGVWHAGSTTNNDFAQPMHEWSKYFEIGFMTICDGIFVGSEYSKYAIVERLLYPLHPLTIEKMANKIYAYGMPLNHLDIQKYYKRDKENIILFPHRPEIEKNPHIFLSIIHGLSMFWEDFSEYKFVFCTSKERYISQTSWINAMLASSMRQFPNIEIRENLSKKEYYELLGKTKLMISTTSEENFGYCPVEAMSLGCNILVPNDFSHPELVEENSHLLYDSYDELMQKIPEAIKSPLSKEELQDYVEPYQGVVREWLKIMRA